MTTETSQYISAEAIATVLAGRMQATDLNAR